MPMRPFSLSNARFALIVLLACATSACELVADFDRDKIPEPPRDAASFEDDAAVTFDAAMDSSTPEDAGGDAQDDDAGG